MKTSDSGPRPQLARSQERTAAATRRIEWADCAKGLSIIGVCLMHVVTGVPGGMETPWFWVSTVLDPLRMPLFFLISGMFAHRIISWNVETLWFRRLWFLLIPYLVYSPVQAVTRLYIEDSLSLTHVVKAVIVGDPGLWFLYTLMAYNLAAVLLRRQPPWLAVALSFVPAIVAAMAGLMVIQGVYQALTYAPIFFLGLHYRSLFFSISHHAGQLLSVAAAVVLFALGELLYRGMDIYYFEGWSEIIASQQSMLMQVRILAAVPMGIMLAVWISYLPVLKSIFGFVGRNTLPIYVSHHAFLALFDLIIYPHLWETQPQLRPSIENPDLRVLWGILICITAGAVFYGLSKVPVVKWTMYPPPLRKPAR